MGILDVLLGRSKPPMFGLDIGLSSIKLVELALDKSGQYTLLHYGQEPLKKEWIKDGQIENIDEVARVLKLLITRSGTKTRQAAIAMPPSLVISKKMVLPAGLNEQELEDRVMAEANQYLPFALDEVTLDFCEIGPLENSPDDVEILIAAARKDKVEDREAVLQSAGITPLVIDLESHASRAAVSRLAELYTREIQNPMVALFEVGGQFTSVKFIRGDQLVHERDQPFGGDVLTSMISRRYSMNLEEAENNKLNNTLPEDYTSGVLEPFLDIFKSECTKALTNFYQTTVYHRVDYIFLSGGAAVVPGVGEKLADLAQGGVMVVNPFDQMQLGGNIRSSDLRKVAPSFLTACGLAMRRFTL